jgi:hypothetical protein
LTCTRSSRLCSRVQTRSGATMEAWQPSNGWPTMIHVWYCSSMIPV